jgi:hypothetical protein
VGRPKGLFFYWYKKGAEANEASDANEANEAKKERR